MDKNLAIVILRSFVFGILVVSLSSCGRGGQHMLVDSAQSSAGQDQAMFTYGYVEDILPIFENRCSLCHPGSAPGDWTEYSQAKARSESIRVRVDLDHPAPVQKMPPGNATGMTEEEREMVITWAEEGAPRGGQQEESAGDSASMDSQDTGESESGGEASEDQQPADAAPSDGATQDEQEPAPSDGDTPGEQEAAPSADPIQDEQEPAPSNDQTQGEQEQNPSQSDASSEASEEETERDSAVSLSYAADIQPIFQNRCSLCHPGAAPGNWMEYEQAFNSRDVIARRVDLDHPDTGQKMPPGNATQMTPEERDLILEWIEAGAPE